MGMKQKVERIEKEIVDINDALVILELENGRKIESLEIDSEPKIFDAMPAVRVLKDHAYKLRRVAGKARTGGL